ncbi:hypothetical protein ICN10_00155 [Polynucleobacter sp. 86C-FISCH]|uniref:hypothetical protein n=1 Tax=Polynucleobacter sp. 86C-FISCH TaxID=2689101 RepID=UPI001C0E595C|nr:hypothetical protein [Polynucleobacter sp. 86C-FISCH]MBU3594811.1 hypothetical protein [Polynucleobacter sp. 86C-FISCH]
MPFQWSCNVEDAQENNAHQEFLDITGSDIDFFSYEQELYKRALGSERVKVAFKEELRKGWVAKSMKSSMINSFWKEVYMDQGYAYQNYCNISIEISNQVFGQNDKFGVTKVEMILFGIADGDIVGEMLDAHMARIYFK